MFRIRERVLIPLLTEKYKRWSRVVARKIHGACRDAESRKVSHPWTVYTSYLLMSKNSIKKSSWKPFLNVWKRENWKLSKNLLSIHVCILRHICFEGKLVLSLTRSNFFTGGNHVNSVPDLAARPPTTPPPPPSPPYPPWLKCTGLKQSGKCKNSQTPCVDTLFATESVNVFKISWYLPPSFKNSHRIL